MKLPPAFFIALHMMDGAGNGTRIEVRPGPGGGENPSRHPAPREGGNNISQPPPQGRSTSA
ncbi:MAG: hypothetical protein ACKVY0_29390 [Prosthecobacter sp.]|uniref:hypothetical protein n=1 Tax=Prosthecobacter sp. TaxID=1965333 RepID=UPI0038FFF54A